MRRKKITDASADDRGTPQWLFDSLNAQHGPFDVDVCASEWNHKCDVWFDKDGLTCDVADKIVWCNPPYSDLAQWTARALTSKAKRWVMLLPANRTEQAWWQDSIEKLRDRRGSGVKTRFIRGRVRFDYPKGAAPKTNSPPFGCVLVIFEGNATLYKPQLSLVGL